MSHRSAELLIEDLWEAIEKVERYTAGFNRNGFIKDDKTVDSVVRNFEILGGSSQSVAERNKRSVY
jgi:uncharacterized protein with HEPN domain